MATKDVSLRRLWRPRAIARLVIPLVLMLVLIQVNRGIVAGFARQWRDPVHYGLVLVAVALAVAAVRAFVRAIGAVLAEYLGTGRAQTAASVISIVLYVIIALITLQSNHLDLSGLLLGSAVTGVIVGIAGQASLSNIIAGIVILFARPYSVGMYLTARAGTFGGVEYSGQVWEISLLYTTLHSGGQEIRIPNSTMVAAVVVVRPQELDVYIPLTLPRTVDVSAILDTLRHDVAACTSRRRVPQVTLESMTDAGFIVGIRVFVGGEAERRSVERAIVGVAQGALASAAQQDTATPTPRDAATPPQVQGAADAGPLTH